MNLFLALLLAVVTPAPTATPIFDANGQPLNAAAKSYVLNQAKAKAAADANKAALCSKPGTIHSQFPVFVFDAQGHAVQGITFYVRPVSCPAAPAPTSTP